eukprot:254756-Pleurochrysis_carterae.AAC.6
MNYLFALSCGPTPKTVDAFRRGVTPACIVSQIVGFALHAYLRSTRAPLSKLWIHRSRMAPAARSVLSDRSHPRKRAQLPRPLLLPHHW